MPFLDNQLKSPSPLLLPARVWFLLHFCQISFELCAPRIVRKRITLFLANEVPMTCTGCCNSTFWIRSHWLGEDMFCFGNRKRYIHCKSFMCCDIYVMTQEDLRAMLFRKFRVSWVQPDFQLFSYFTNHDSKWHLMSRVFLWAKFSESLLPYTLFLWAKLPECYFPIDLLLNGWFNCLKVMTHYHRPVFLNMLLSNCRVTSWKWSY